MASPTVPDARLFYRSAKQRFADAQFLLEGNRTTAAVYLAGYAVECILKALILSALPRSTRIAVAASFRGAKAHDFGWLKLQYFKAGGAAFPAEIAHNFVVVNTWNTDLRYNPGSVKLPEAVEFLKTADGIIEWAEGRL